MSENWLDVDWSSTWRPSDSDAEQSLQRLRFHPAPPGGPAESHLVEVFRSLLRNGGAHISSFDISHSDAAAAWYMSRNRPEYRLAEWLVRSPAYATAVPQVGGRVLSEPNFGRKSALDLDGALAIALQWGGALSETMPGAEAKAIGTAFCDSVFGHRYDDVIVDHSVTAWSPWFKGIAWDATWVIIDKRNLRASVLCITDTD